MANKFYILFLGALAVIAARGFLCMVSSGQTPNRPQPYERDSITDLIKYYGADSIYTYRSNGTIKLIRYQATDNLISAISYYDGGLIAGVEYNTVEGNDLKYKTYYPNGNVQSEEYEKDTIIVTAGNPTNVFKQIKRYHPNGNLETCGYHGSFLGQIMNVGQWYYYNDMGGLIKIENYVFPPQADAASINENAFYYFIRADFYETGQPKSKIICSNWAETDFPHTPVGEWVEFDLNGNVVKAKRYSDLKISAELGNEDAADYLKSTAKQMADQ